MPLIIPTPHQITAKIKSVWRTGTAMGITSAVGYSTDLWLYTLCGNWLDAYGNAGYRNILLLYLAGLAVVVVCAILLHRYEKSHNLISSASGSIES